QQYEDQVMSFLHTLMVLVHLTGGQPLREPELLSCTVYHGATLRRSLFCHTGRVMLATTYHKSQQLTGEPIRSYRFLHPRVGSLILQYLAYVVPFR
ncbi:hypothetical protein CXG81DRAFT_976, partial [Caulochytrium protostelioides]